MKKNMLKKWLIVCLSVIFLSLSAVGLTSCTDDDKESESSTTDTTVFPEVELPWDEF